jgi:predicted acyltransferase
MDAYRGFVMFLMMAEVLRLARVSQAFPGNWFWSILAYNQTHVPWAGCSLHDLIQPSFMFMVGVAMPLDTRATLRPDAEQAERAILGGTRMARRRFQHGSLFQRGSRHKV